MDVPAGKACDNSALLWNLHIVFKIKQGVTVTADTLLVNVGDMLETWLDSYGKPTQHNVVSSGE
jgi:hypothetical protein